MSIILTCNAGSTNNKLAVFDAITLERTGDAVLTNDSADVVQWFRSFAKRGITAIGHRVVHGGLSYTHPEIMTDAVLDKLKTYIPLAPLHQPAALTLIEEARRLYPDVPHIACFDTAFHHTMSEIERRFALPKAYFDQGVMRYGFHGISYQHIAAVLPKHAGRKAKGRIIVAHLGGGSSACAMKDLKSVASTMGFSTLDGLMMGTRCGALDPGVVLYLLQEKNMTAEEVSHLLYHESGLKGVSGVSGDMRELLESKEAVKAPIAVELYCALAAKHIAGLLPSIGGIDLLVFTGGIGEHAAAVRERILFHLGWLGIEMDAERNQANALLISGKDSDIPVYVISTDEETVIAQACRKALG